MVKWNVEDIFSWLRKDYLVFKEDYMVSGFGYFLKVSGKVFGYFFFEVYCL